MCAGDPVEPATCWKYDTWKVIIQINRRKNPIMIKQPIVITDTGISAISRYQPFCWRSQYFSRALIGGHRKLDENECWKIFCSWYLILPVPFNTFQSKIPRLTCISQAGHNHYQQIIKNKVSLLVFTQHCPASVSAYVGTQTGPRSVSLLTSWNGGVRLMKRSKLLPWPLRNGVQSNWSRDSRETPFDASAIGTWRLTAQAKTGAFVVCFCHLFFFIPPPKEKWPCRQAQVSQPEFKHACLGDQTPPLQ